MSDIDDLLHKLYYSTKSPASYSSAQKLYKEAKLYSGTVTLKYVKEWLKGELTYTLHKQSRKNFKRNPVFVSRIDEQWQADLVDMQEYSSYNNGIKYILTVIDILSKYAWVVTLKSKNAVNIVKGLEKIFKFGRIPQKLQTDRGTEFLNKQMKVLMKRYKINHFTSTHSVKKCSIVERFNRTLKAKMFKYFTATGSKKYIYILQDLLSSYNNSVNRSIKMKPIDVNSENEKKILQNLYNVNSKREYLLSKVKEPKLAMNQIVRKKYDLNVLEKGYFPLWSDETYKIYKAKTGKNTPIYQIKKEGKSIEGNLYPEQIQEINPNFYRVEKIIKRKIQRGKIMYYVKWLNHSSTENSWIPANYIRKLLK